MEHRDECFVRAGGVKGGQVPIKEFNPIVTQ